MFEAPQAGEAERACEMSDFGEPFELVNTVSGGLTVVNFKGETLALKHWERIVQSANALAGIRNPCAIPEVIHNLREIVNAYGDKLTPARLRIAKAALAALDADEKGT